MLDTLSQLPDQLLNRFLPKVGATASDCTWNCFRPCGGQALRPCCCRNGVVVRCAAGCI